MSDFLSTLLRRELGPQAADAVAPRLPSALEDHAEVGVDVEDAPTTELPGVVGRQPTSPPDVAEPVERAGEHASAETPHDSARVAAAAGETLTTSRIGETPPGERSTPVPRAVAVRSAAEPTTVEPRRPRIVTPTPAVQTPELQPDASPTVPYRVEVREVERPPRLIAGRREYEETIADAIQPRPDTAVRRPLADAPAQPAPTIHVTIGRVEVRSIPVEAPARRDPVRPNPPMGLDEYIERRNRTSRP